MVWWINVLLILSSISLAYWWFSDDKLHTLKGKRVLVTGSSDGIGEQIAYNYARLGANVVVTARREERLNKVVEKCQTLSPSPDAKFFAVPADMSKMNDTKKVVEQAIKNMGGLDILVLNHMKGSHRGAFEGKAADLEEFDFAMEVNFRSYVYVAAHALPQLLANDGSIIIINSLVGKVPQVFFPSYSASKNALNGFFHSLRSQFLALNQNVSVTSCFLGLIGTNSVLKQLNKAKDSFLKNTLMVPASPSDTALDIIRGGVNRQDEVFSPYIAGRPIPILYGMFPGLVESFFRLCGTLIEQ